MAESPDLAVVYRTYGHLRAELIRSKLELAGIPAMLSYDSASIVFGILVDGLGEVRVLVPASLADEARQVIAELPEPLSQEETDAPLPEE